MEITKQKSELKKALLRIALAKTSICRAKAACDYIFANIKTPEHPLHAPLVTAIFVFYARPFGKNVGVGPLPPEFQMFSNPSKKNLHELLVCGRDKFCAHTDGGCQYYDAQDHPVDTVFQLEIIANFGDDGKAA